MRYSELVASLTTGEGGACVGAIPDNWVQGRTTFGGLTAALCLEGALRAFPDLPPLRSALLSFIAPVGGIVTVIPNLLRRGKSVAVVNADLMTGEGIAARAVFSFGATRPSTLTAHFLPMPSAPAADTVEPLPNHPQIPSFVRNFDRRYVRGGAPFSGSTDCDTHFWVRHADEDARSLAALLALADMPPPAFFPMFSGPAPISTMTWHANFLDEDISSDDGWYLVESRAESAAGGYSSQDMFVWSRSGRPLIAARQSVAVFL